MRSSYDPDTNTRYEEVEKKYVDLETGEIVSRFETKVVRLGRKRYYRAIKGAFYKALSVLGGTSIKTALYIVENCNTANVYLGSYEDLQRVIGVSNKTITDAMVELQENDIIRMAHPAQWMFNPRLAVSCYDEDITVLLDRYDSLKQYQRRRKKNKEKERDDSEDVT